MSQPQNSPQPQVVSAFQSFLHNVGIYLAILLFSAATAIAGVNVPDWVRKATAQPVGTYPPETKAVVLLDQTDYTIKDRKSVV